MSNRQNNTSEKINLADFFNNPKNKRQRQYEAVRSIIIDNLSYEEAAKKYGYKITTLYSLIRDVKNNRIDLFPEIQTGPKGRRVDVNLQNKIIQYRKMNSSTPEIHKRLKEENIDVSVKTIERILKDAGFSKLKRRTNIELGITSTNKLIPETSVNLDFETLKPFKTDCPQAGVFFFIPYIIESGILDIAKRCKLPGSSIISSTSACLSMLLLKLIGNERLSHMDSYDSEPGLGVFAGLNVLPKATYMSTYSCLTNEDMLLDFQKQIIKQFKKVFPELYGGKFINLDFHSIPHNGDDQSMEKIWCGSKGKTLRGANTIFAQDAQHNTILYTRADILRKEESNEIMRFISYWKNVKGSIDETLVFDCKFTRYTILDELTNDGIKFITLRKRNAKLLEQTFKIPSSEWKKIYLPIPKRKHKKVSIYENHITLPKCKNTFRQIIIKDHGRLNPTYIITNDTDLLIKSVMTVYAKRWHVENKLAELVAFFNLNALSSPLMIRIHFDILWTLIADTLYHKFAMDLRRFENLLAPTIFKKFINIPGRVHYDGSVFKIKIRKRSYTPILMGVEKINRTFKVPWLDNKLMKIEWIP